MLVEVLVIGSRYVAVCLGIQEREHDPCLVEPGGELALLSVNECVSSSVEDESCDQLLGSAFDTTHPTLQDGTRYYDPTLGRFMQVDPIAGGSANAYDYTEQDPINGHDADGTIAWFVPIGIVALRLTPIAARAIGAALRSGKSVQAATRAAAKKAGKSVARFGKTTALGAAAVARVFRDCLARGLTYQSRLGPAMPLGCACSRG